MAPLCAEFGISRKTGDKIFDRYKDWSPPVATAVPERKPDLLEGLPQRLARRVIAGVRPEMHAVVQHRVQIALHHLLEAVAHRNLFRPTQLHQRLIEACLVTLTSLAVPARRNRRHNG